MQWNDARTHAVKRRTLSVRTRMLRGAAQLSAEGRTARGDGFQQSRGCTAPGAGATGRRVSDPPRGWRWGAQRACASQGAAPRAYHRLRFHMLLVRWCRAACCIARDWHGGTTVELRAESDLCAGRWRRGGAGAWDSAGGGGVGQRRVPCEDASAARALACSAVREDHGGRHWWSTCLP